MTKTHRRTAHETRPDAAADAFSFGGNLPSSPPSEREHRMLELGISHDGLRFGYNGYRYDRLADAINYATLMRSRPAQDDIAGPSARGKAFVKLTAADRALMASLAIDFNEGSYRFQDFRYDLLSDAVSYARLTQRRNIDDAATVPRTYSTEHRHL